MTGPIAKVVAALCGALVGLSVVSTMVQAQNAAPETLEVPPGMFTLDAGRIADERTGNAVVAATREALARTGVLFAPKEIRELALHDAALSALQRNLDIKRSGLGKDIVQRALIEAEAVFDPVFTLSTTGSMSRSFGRVERPMQWKPATQEYVRGQQIKTSESIENIFLCGDMIDILDQPQGNRLNRDEMPPRQDSCLRPGPPQWFQSGKLLTSPPFFA